MKTLKNFVGGQFVDPAQELWIDNVDPARQRVINRIPTSDAGDVARAVAAAQAALDGEYGQMDIEGRCLLLDGIADRLEASLGEFARLESEDTGKPLSLARSVDIPRAVANFRFFARLARMRGEEFFSSTNSINYIHRVPLGVVGLITPWNLPLYLLSWKLAPALAMGNAVVAKPSEMTPQTADALAGIFADVGAPRGCFNVVHGLGASAGQALVEHEGVAAISFTGGTETGRRVAATAAPRFAKLSLELGGKNPTVIFADADIDAAVEGALASGFRNQGQICLCGSRILVAKEIYDEFVTALAEKVRTIQVGDPSDENCDFGSLISLAHRDKVESYLKLACEEGGEILCGGERPGMSGDLASGAFLTPAIVGGLDPNCRTATEEIFGPVVTVHPFQDDAEALAMANGTRYGLSASVWTADLQRAHRFSAELRCGMVWINGWMIRDLRVPFGGSKESGVGREGGRWSLEFFSEARNICVNLGAKRT